MNIHIIRFALAIVLSMISGVAMAVDDVTISDIDSKVTTANSKAEGNQNRIQNLMTWAAEFESTVLHHDEQISDITEQINNKQEKRWISCPEGQFIGAIGPGGEVECRKISHSQELTIISEKLTHDVSPWTSSFFVVYCPVGWKLSGGGVSVSAHDVTIYRTAPNPANNGWEIGVFNNSGATREVSGFALCAAL